MCCSPPTRLGGAARAIYCSPAFFLHDGLFGDQKRGFVRTPPPPLAMGLDCRRLLKSAGIILINMKLKIFLKQALHVSTSLTVLCKFIHFHSDYLQCFQIAITHSARRPKQFVFQYRFFSLPAQNWDSWNCLPPLLTTITSLLEFRKALRLRPAKIYYCRYLLPHITLFLFLCSNTYYSPYRSHVFYTF